MGRKLQNMFSYCGPWQPNRPLPYTTCFSTRTRPFPIPFPLIGCSELWAKHFPYLYPSTQILGITSTLYAYEDGTDRKFRNVGTNSSDARRLPKKHNTATFSVVPCKNDDFFSVVSCKIWRALNLQSDASNSKYFMWFIVESISIFCSLAKLNVTIKLCG